MIKRDTGIQLFMNMTMVQAVSEAERWIAKNTTLTKILEVTSVAIDHEGDQCLLVVGWKKIRKPGYEIDRRSSKTGS